MKVVLVNPPSPPEFRVSRGLMGGFGMAVNPGLLYPPIELAHVASVLESDGHQVAIVDADPFDLDLDGTLARVVAEAPGFVCLDSSSTSLDQDLGLAKRIREALKVPVAMLGSQVTYTPGEIFDGENVDAVVRGEPEYTVRDLVRRAADGAAYAERRFEGVEGVTYRRADGEIVHEPERDKISTLDDLPIPARHLLDNSRYRFPGIEGAITTVKSSRGCPLNCSFCGYTLAQGLRFRFRSPESVLAELEDLYFTHGIRHVVFRDPIFTTRKDRIHAICDGIIAKGMTGLEWQCETAVKTLDREVLQKMAAAGCRHISLGVESGNAEIQKKHCGNKLSDLDKAEEVFRAARDYGIETRAFCMIGFPEETPEMADETIRLVERFDPDQVQFCAVTAYPGTPLYQMLRGEREFDYATMTGFQALEGNEHMTAAQIEEKIREAYRSFYLRPRRIVRELRHPGRLASKVARYFTLFRRRA
ncbi:B12-binding domain-containing radical SAM protein [Engelhardtia mirabilis]|uniref:Coproporphyrinogen III oxidase n=1 Tax=Engelhardtia mirabilis TaxID=2528011 RepID=A0A518BK68_9BACT|nr:coproporphyrinogen III oxidase [Planctomycetes bacterium Pla133]QDV01691.1 coproporphyrinogen III oxidase [Planctomycetes bacterium Pla86]